MLGGWISVEENARSREAFKLLIKVNKESVAIENYVTKVVLYAWR